MTTAEDYISKCFYVDNSKVIKIMATGATTDVTTFRLGNLSFKIDLSKEEIEIPCIYMSPILYDLERRVFATKDTIQYYPIVSNGVASRTCTTSLGLLKQFFDNYSTNVNCLTKAVCKDTYYYGGKGIILYKDFSPMVICSMTYKKEKGPNTSSIFHYVPTGTIVRLNSKVFIENDLLSKYIRTKFIISITGALRETNTNMVSLVGGSSLSRPFTMGNARVIIDSDLSDIIVTPSAPTSNNNIEEFLKNNAEDILDKLCL